MFGHIRRNYKQKDKGQEQSNLVQEDVEPTVLMAVQEKRDKDKKIFLNEKEIKPKKYISTDESLWFLDNGASNHMTGIRTHFKVVEKISGRVRFGDGSYVKIKGREKLKSFRTDRGGEFTSREFIHYCKENGILRQLTSPYSLQQNGIVERRNRSDSTPYEALKDGKPNMRHLRVFRCKAYAKTNRLFNPVTKDMVVSRDVKFKEDEGWEWKVSTQDLERNDEDSAPSPMQNNTHGDISDDDDIEQPIDNPSTPPPYTYEPNLEDSTGYTSSIASSSSPFDHTPVHGYKNLSKIYDRAPEVQSDELLLLEEEPRNYKESAQDKK
nr:zinc finger, CCHC-type [Tanacetum cinerariifolium]GEX90288.1 zinc finger, CCHC-type [Tanacetum cinerariifolium]